MGKTLIHNAIIVNEGRQTSGSVLIEGDIIAKIITGNTNFDIPGVTHFINAGGNYLIPGLIDEHVHFREPGLTHKADMESESAAAVAGGVTSVLEMPNTNPKTICAKQLNTKLEIASMKMLCNYGFFLGATADNIEEICASDTTRVCGVKLFLAASTENMQVEGQDTITELFRQSPLPIMAHCEDETLIAENLNKFSKQYNQNIPVHLHPLIRDTESCYRSSAFAIEQAVRYGARLHIAHLSTAKELQLLRHLNRDQISAEVCIPHLVFSDHDYPVLGSRIKCNPSVKTAEDRDALIDALADGTLLTVASDHAPHTLQEKENPYTTCPSGIPMVQHSFMVLAELYQAKRIRIERIVETMCHAPARLFSIQKRGFIREGYYADLVLADIHKTYTVNEENILYKCRWSPFSNRTFSSSITHTWVNGHLVYENGKIFNAIKGMPLFFNH